MKAVVVIRAERRPQVNVERLGPGLMRATTELSDDNARLLSTLKELLQDGPRRTL
jgi:hypothetical protein